MGVESVASTFPRHAAWYWAGFWTQVASGIGTVYALARTWVTYNPGRLRALLRKAVVPALHPRRGM
jgi:hypothetical protein